MPRPLLLRVLPDRARLSAFARLYSGRHGAWPGLYAAAPLRHAPGIRMELVPGDVISDSIAFTGIYELALTRRLVERGREGGLLVDVGANLGYVSLVWAAANPRNRCLALEAAPRNLEIMRRNIASNGMAGRIDLRAVAADVSPGRRRFDPGPDAQSGWGGFSEAGGARAFEVETARVDDLVGDRPVALLKVDIEGADLWALQGSERLLRAKLVDEIWYEQNKPRMSLLSIPHDAPRDFLASLGYESRPLGDPGAAVVEWSATPRSARPG